MVGVQIVGHVVCTASSGVCTASMVYYIMCTASIVHDAYTASSDVLW